LLNRKVLVQAPIGAFSFFGGENQMKSIEKITQLAESVASNNGVKLYDLELIGAGKGKILRIFIDKDDVAGVSLDDCSNVSKGMSLLLDVEDPIEGAYNLEVSSPGLERVLKKPWHYVSSVGKEISVNLNRHLGKIVTDVPGPVASRKKLLGILLEASEEAIELDMGQETKVKIPMEFVVKAHWVFNYEKNVVKN
jgi:ribosome maturation factor RimP